MPRTVPILVASSLLVGAVTLGGPVAAGAAPAATRAGSAATRCAPARGERVVARSSLAVVLERTDVRLVGCSRRTGRRRVLQAFVPVEDTFHGFPLVRLRGTVVAYTSYSGDRTDTVDSLFVDDAVHSRRRRLLWIGPVAELVLGPAGRVAYITRSNAEQRVGLVEPGRSGRRIDRGRTLDGVRFTSTMLLWRHAGSAAAAPLAQEDRCTVGRSGGTLELDVELDGLDATAVTACWRATGQTATLPLAPRGAVAWGGSWLAAVQPDGSIRAVDVTSDATVIVAADRVDGLAVDAAGSLGWMRTDATTFARQVWAHDASGTRMLDDHASPGDFGFDGSTLLWDRNAAPLSP